MPPNVTACRGDSLFKISLNTFIPTDRLRTAQRDLSFITRHVPDECDLSAYRSLLAPYYPTANLSSNPDPNVTPVTLTNQPSLTTNPNLSLFSLINYARSQP